jgi:hypothetical protein
MHFLITSTAASIRRAIAQMLILCALLHLQMSAATITSDLWLPSRGYLERAQAPVINFYQSDAAPIVKGVVPLYRDFMLHYNQSLMAAAAPAEVEEVARLEPDSPAAMSKPPVLSPKPSKKVRVFHSGGATLKGPYAFPRPQHTDRLFDEIYLHFPVSVDQQQEMSIQGELNQSAVFEPPTVVTPSSSSSYLQVP